MSLDIREKNRNTVSRAVSPSATPSPGGELANPIAWEMLLKVVSAMPEVTPPSRTVKHQEGARTYHHWNKQEYECLEMYASLDPADRPPLKILVQLFNERHTYASWIEKIGLYRRRGRFYQRA